MLEKNTDTFFSVSLSCSNRVFCAPGGDEWAGEYVTGMAFVTGNATGEQSASASGMKPMDRPFNPLKQLLEGRFQSKMCSTASHMDDNDDDDGDGDDESDNSDGGSERGAIVDNTSSKKAQHEDVDGEQEEEGHENVVRPTQKRKATSDTPSKEMLATHKRNRLRQELENNTHLTKVQRRKIRRVLRRSEHATQSTLDNWALVLPREVLNVETDESTTTATAAAGTTTTSLNERLSKSQTMESDVFYLSSWFDNEASSSINMDRDRSRTLIPLHWWKDPKLQLWTQLANFDANKGMVAPVSMANVLILCGPTGSGKTTFLYHSLSKTLARTVFQLDPVCTTHSITVQIQNALVRFRHKRLIFHLDDVHPLSLVTWADWAFIEKLYFQSSSQRSLPPLVIECRPDEFRKYRYSPLNHWKTRYASATLVYSNAIRVGQLLSVAKLRDALVMERKQKEGKTRIGTSTIKDTTGAAVRPNRLVPTSVASKWSIPTSPKRKFNNRMLFQSDEHKSNATKLATTKGADATTLQQNTLFVRHEWKATAMHFACAYGCAGDLRQFQLLLYQREYLLRSHTLSVQEATAATRRHLTVNDSIQKLTERVKSTIQAGLFSSLAFVYERFGRFSTSASHVQAVSNLRLLYDQSVFVVSSFVGSHIAHQLIDVFIAASSPVSLPTSNTSWLTLQRIRAFELDPEKMYRRWNPGQTTSPVHSTAHDLIESEKRPVNATATELNQGVFGMAQEEKERLLRIATKRKKKRLDQLHQPDRTIDPQSSSLSTDAQSLHTRRWWRRAPVTRTQTTYDISTKTTPAHGNLATVPSNDTALALVARTLDMQSTIDHHTHRLRQLLVHFDAQVTYDQEMLLFLQASMSLTMLFTTESWTPEQRVDFRLIATRMSPFRNLHSFKWHDNQPHVHDAY